MAGAGRVFRDHLGNWILGFARNIGHTTSIVAELWAIRDGLKLAVSRGYNGLILETDSRTALTLLHAENCNFHSLAVLISDCRVLLRQLPDVQTTHIYREANSVADCLAKIGTRLNNPFAVFEQCNMNVAMLLLSDTIGNSVPRDVTII
ncbi:hypothetical protein SLEP1_g23837 [Rubroshorea leprosula]|nr:hypothetical protein SLEP1_g23837 [Rubroshorea leprosula]